MSDFNFLRLPVGEGPIRIKFERAEWTPQKNKLILHPPIAWYCENDPSQKGETKDEILMLDAGEAKRELTNPIRIALEWGDVKGQPPNRTMLMPPDGATPVTPTQAKGRGGGKGGGARAIKPADFEAAVDASLAAMERVSNKLALSTPESVATAFSKVLGVASLVSDWGDASPEADAPPPPDDIEF